MSRSSLVSFYQCSWGNFEFCGFLHYYTDIGFYEVLRLKRMFTKWNTLCLSTQQLDEKGSYSSDLFLFIRTLGYSIARGQNGRHVHCRQWRASEQRWIWWDAAISRTKLGISFLNSKHSQLQLDIMAMAVQFVKGKVSRVGEFSRFSAFLFRGRKAVIRSWKLSH